MIVTSGYCIHSQDEMTLSCNSNKNDLEIISDQDGGWRVKRVESLTVQNLTQSMSLTVESLKELWAKEFLPNIRKEIRLEIDSLKASLLDLNKTEKPN